LSAGSLQAVDETDPAPPGSDWTGTYKRVKPRAAAGEKVASTSVKLKFTERDGNKFKAEVWFGGGRGFELQGTVAKAGSENFQAAISKILKGEFEDAIVGRKIEGYCRNGVLQAKHVGPAGTSIGELDLKMEKSR
jgi:hypothetical protein